MTLIPIIILVVVIAIALWLIVTFNGLVVLKNRAKEAWADIDVQLKRRYDLIPNLVETVKGYATHEKELFEKVLKTSSMSKFSKLLLGYDSIILFPLRIKIFLISGMDFSIPFINFSRLSSESNSESK